MFLKEIMQMFNRGTNYPPYNKKVSRYLTLHSEVSIVKKHRRFHLYVKGIFKKCCRKIGLISLLIQNTDCIDHTLLWLSNIHFILLLSKTQLVSSLFLLMLSKLEHKKSYAKTSCCFFTIGRNHVSIYNIIETLIVK